MTTLRNKTPKDTYKELLKINGAGNGAGLDTTLRDVEGGDGTATPLQLATDKIAIQGKQWPTTDAPSGAVLQVSSDPTKLEWNVPGAAVTNSITSSFFPGAISPLAGTIRWYPGKPAHLKSVFLSVSTAPTTTLMIDVKKTGESIFTGNKPTIDASNFISPIIELDVQMLATDYLTVDILSGNGTDLVVRFEYQ